MNNLLERVNDVCKDVRDRNQTPIDFNKLLRQTRAAFKKHGFDLSIKTKREKDLQTDKFYVMAYYDNVDDAENLTPIEVFVHHNLTGSEQFGTYQITNFLIEIYDAVVHEHRHQYQSIRRNHAEYAVHTRSPFEEYLSNQDELDAYALSIAIEMLRAMDKDRAKRYMSRITVMSKMRKGANFAIPMLRTYISYFGLSPIIKTLAKKVYKHLETLDKNNIFM